MKHWNECPLTAAALRDPVFAPRIEANRRTTIPANIEQCRKTKRLEAFKLKPQSESHIFWDSDVAKVAEGMALDLILHPDPARRKQLDRLADLIVSAQQPDGYLNTYFTIHKEAKRWGILAFNHELYCAGHLMEAAVAHFRATGRRNFLDCMCRYADYIAKVFGRGKGQKRGYPGHEEIELALCKLADATGKSKYRKLAQYFINERGQSPNYFTEVEKSPASPAYFQAHKPVREQTEAVGHAVRACYLYRGMADVAERTDDSALLNACETLFNDITQKKMYITGGIGSTFSGERFENAYTLPNDTAYAETCAAIALALFSRDMLNITGNSKYADVMETALCNGILSGIELKGDKFFYANPLEVTHDFCDKNPIYAERVPWFGCSCCPTNLCRFFPQLAALAFSGTETEAAVHIPAAASVNLGGLSFEIESRYPYSGTVGIRMNQAEPGKRTLSLRIPGWCRTWSISLNGKKLRLQPENGYVSIARGWKSGDRVNFELEMPARVLRANGRVAADAGKIALVRGPVVYCLEECDNVRELSQLVIPADQNFSSAKAKGLPEGTPAIAGTAFLESGANPSDALYFSGPVKRRKTSFLAVPYALWNNRGKGSMSVWLRAE